LQWHAVTQRFFYRQSNGVTDFLGIAIALDDLVKYGITKYNPLREIFGSWDCGNDINMVNRDLAEP
jgi:hypothetical protein